jgi:hypothetical protein
MRSLIFTALLAIAAAGCAPPATIPDYTLDQITPAPAVPLVPQPSHRIAYVVLDPAKVPANLTLEVMNEPVMLSVTTTDPKANVPIVKSEPMVVHGATDFVTRDLVHALGAYFDDVRVVAPGQPISGPAVIVDVRLDHLNIDTTALDVSNQGGGTQTDATSNRGALTWSIDMRLAETNAPVFSFSGDSKGTGGYDYPAAVRSALEHAITDVVQANLNKPEIQAELASASAS